jgi:DnaJ domain
MPNHYEVLHLAPDATQEQIRVSYHKLARELHPDRRPRRQQQKRNTPLAPAPAPLRPTRPHAPDSDRCETADDLVRSSSCDEHHVRKTSSELKAPALDTNNEGCFCDYDDDDDDDDERFREVQDAYRCLYDPSKRRDYDEALRLQENRRKSRRRSAVALTMSDCRWVSETAAVESQSRRGGENGDKQVSHGHHDGSVDAKDPALTLDVDGGDAAAVLMYTCRCGEDLYPLEDEDDALGGGDVNGDEGCLLDCPGCSAVYDVSVLREEAEEQGPPLS